MKSFISMIAIASMTLGAACNREQKKVDQVPVGSDVQLTRADGALVEGKLLDRSADAVKLDTGPATASVPRDEIADLRVKPEADAPAPKAAKFREIILPATTPLVVRLDTPVSSATSAVETPVHGELTRAIVRDGVTVVPAGARVSGIVSGAHPSGRVKGRASLALAFDSLSFGNAHYAISSRYSRVAPATKAKDAKTIGIPAAGGAAVGAIIGGKKGAAIGAAAGGGAGTAVVLSTRGREVTLGRGAVLSMQAGRSLTVRVPLES
jgi:hypothetical protein